MSLEPETVASGSLKSRRRGDEKPDDVDGYYAAPKAEHARAANDDLAAIQSIVIRNLRSATWQAPNGWSGMRTHLPMSDRTQGKS